MTPIIRQANPIQHVACATLALALLSLLALSGCSTDNVPERSDDKAEGIAVVVEEAVTGSVTEKVNTTGTVMAEHQSLISAEAGGRVVELPVALGSRVAQGDLLARLDPTVSRAQVQQARASLLQAKAGLELAEVQLERTQALHVQSAASDQMLDQARIERDSRAGGVKAAEAGLALSEKSLADCSLRAPFAGTVAKVDLELGALVGPGTPAFQLVSAEKLFVLSMLSSGLIGSIAIDMQVRLQAPSLPGRSFSGRVARLGPAADMRTRTYPVEIDLEDSEEVLRPGMMVQVEIVLEQRGSAILVGRSSVLDEPNSRVFVISDGVAHLRKVKTGLSVGDQIEVQSGLRAGELVVSLGHQQLIDGSSVHIYDMPELPGSTQDSPAASAAASTGVGVGSN